VTLLDTLRVMAGDDLGSRSVCPECGLPGISILYGYPNERGWADAAAGLCVLGGCVVQPGMADFACPRHHRWRRGTSRRDGPESPEFAASRSYVSGDLAGAERAYRELLDASTRERGERDGDTRALRHGLAIVLAAAGRADEAAATYAPLRASVEDVVARIEDRYRRADLAGQPPE
jgi:hypothetical protein